LGPDWASEINKLSRAERLRLTAKLQERGIRRASVFTKLFKLSGRDLRLIKLGMVGGQEQGVNANNIGGEGAFREADAGGGASGTDQEYVTRMRAKSIVSTKPTEMREIQDVAFHHNLEQAVEMYAVHLLNNAGLVKLDDETVVNSDWRKAFLQYSDVLDGLIKFKDGAKMLEDLKTDNELYEMFLMATNEAIDKLIAATKMYKEAFEFYRRTLPEILCSSCQQRLINRIIAYSGGT